MPKYTYNARDVRGRPQSGSLEAASESEAIRRLRSEGLTVTDISISSALLDVERLRTQQMAKNVKREEVISFSAQLSVMLDTGVPLSEALRAFLAQCKGGGFARVVEIVADRINSGVAFSVSIAEFPKVFPTLMVSLVRASEAAGALASMLGRVSTYLGKERKTVRQIKGALTYPALMLGMALVVTTFLVGWVLPRFARIYEARSAALPKPTRLLLDFSGFITGNWIALLIAVVAVAVGAFFGLRSRQGRYALDWVKIHAPVIGPIFRNFYLSRATRTLGTLLAAGVTLPEAVRIVRGVTSNELWTRLWDRIEGSMTSGRTIAEVVCDTPLIPPSVAQMIAAGERTGRLPTVLERVSEVCEEDLEEAVKTGTQMIEPAVITFMGLLIGGIAIALLLPIFTLGRMMGK